MLATFSGFLLSVQSVLVRYLGSHVHSQEILWGRSVTAALVIWLVLRLRGERVISPSWPRLILQGALGCIAASLFFLALTRLPASEATVLFYLNPPLAMLGAAVFAREPMSMRILTGSMISFVGVIVLCRPAFLVGSVSPGRDVIGLVAGVSSAVFFALATIATRLLVMRDSAERASFYVAGCIAVGTIPWLGTTPHVPPRSIAMIALIGVLAAAQLYCLSRALALERAAPVAAVGYVQVLFVTVLGAASLGEWPDGLAVVGMLFILAGRAAFL